MLRREDATPLFSMLYNENNIENARWIRHFLWFIIILHDGDGGDDDVHQNGMSLHWMKNDDGDGVRQNENCFSQKNKGENLRWIRHFLMFRKNWNESHHCYDGGDDGDDEHS